MLPDSDEEFMAPAVYARSPFRRGEEVLVPASDEARRRRH